MGRQDDCRQDIIGSLLGEHYVAVSDPRYVTGRFNSHLVSALLLHADEGFWAGDHAAEGKIKDLVTGDFHFVEFKGKEPIKIRNYVRLLVTGNPDWLVPAGMEERRFAVFDVAEDHMQDHRYFAAIEQSRSTRRSEQQALDSARDALASKTNDPHSTICCAQPWLNSI